MALMRRRLRQLPYTPAPDASGQAAIQNLPGRLDTDPNAPVMQILTDPPIDVYPDGRKVRRRAELPTFDLLTGRGLEDAQTDPRLMGRNPALKPRLLPEQEPLEPEPMGMLPEMEDQRLVPVRPPSSTDLSWAARQQLPSPGGMAGQGGYVRPGGFQNQQQQQASLRGLYTDEVDNALPAPEPRRRRGWQPPSSPEELDARMSAAQQMIRQNDLRRMERRARHPFLTGMLREWARPGSVARDMELAQAREKALAQKYADLGIPRPVGGFTGRAITDPATYEDLWAAMETDRQKEDRRKLQQERARFLQALPPGFKNRLTVESLWHINNDEVLDAGKIQFAPSPMPTVQTIGAYQFIQDPITGNWTKLGPAPVEPGPPPTPGVPFWAPGAAGGRGDYRMLPAPRPGKTPHDKAMEEYPKKLEQWEAAHWKIQQDAQREIAEAERKRSNAMQRLKNSGYFDEKGNVDKFASPTKVQADREDLLAAEDTIKWWQKHLEDHAKLRPQEPVEPAGPPTPGSAGPGTPQAGGPAPPTLDGIAAMGTAKKMWLNRTDLPEPQRARMIHQELMFGMRFPDNLARIVMASAGIPVDDVGGLAQAQSLQQQLPSAGPAAGANVPQMGQQGQDQAFTTRKHLVDEGARLFGDGYGLEEVQSAQKALLVHAGYPEAEAEKLSYDLAAESEAKYAEQGGLAASDE